jgi:hypothetical protein
LPLNAGRNPINFVNLSPGVQFSGNPQFFRPFDNGDATPFLRELAAGLKADANVRGALVGRNVLFPRNDDPLAIAEAVGGIIYKGWSVEQAVAAQAQYRSSRMDWVSRYFD